MPIRSLLIAAGVLAMIGSGVAFGTYFGPHRTEDTQTLVRNAPGHELGMVLLVSPECGASNHPGLPDAWHQLVARTLDDSVGYGSVRLIGVSVSRDPNEGSEFLSRFGQFDEMLSGGGSHGSGALRYILSDHPGPASIPQVVIFEREFAAADGTLRLVSERISRRIWGVDEIFRAAGLPFP